jgi:hypothetical protein
MAYTTINNPSAHFHTQLYAGTGSLNSVTNDANSGNFKPDWIQIKNRDAGWSAIVTDSNRGVNRSLFTPATDAQITDNARGYVSAFNTDGFTVGAGSGGSDNVNTNGQNYVAWQWKANGGTTASNYDGSITSTVQANTTAGFSMVTWTGTGSNGTVGHGLNAAPDFIIFKNYTANQNWVTYHSVLGNGGGMYLNLTNSFNTASSWYQDQSPTSDYFYVGTNTKTNGGTMIAYCFTDIKGYSKFGKYSGNGDVDGPFVYTGFKPAWLMVKRSDTSGDWLIWDTKRSTYNISNKVLKADSSGAENSGYWDIDFLSNGFKVRKADGELNGTTLTFMAFAENPLVATNDVIALAK